VNLFKIRIIYGIITMKPPVLLIYTNKNSKKITDRVTLWNSNSTLGYKPKSIESRGWKRYLSSVYNCQRWKYPKWPSTEEQITKEWHTLMVEYKIMTCYYVVEPWRHYANQNKPITERQILYTSTYMRILD
jgi:hypothetical protein